MLLERDLIQSTGFRNVREGGEITGFQLRVRIPNYRGLYASLIDGISVRVGDLVDVRHDVPLWTLGGKTYTLEQLWDSDGVRWPLEEAAVVTVPLPGWAARRHARGVGRDPPPRLVHPDRAPADPHAATRCVTLTSESDGGPFKYGVSLYSYTGDFSTVLDLETSMAAIADLGATGIEILGEGHVAGYPNPSTAWVDEWFRLLEVYGLEPTNLGSWIDTRLHSSGANARDMTAAEGAAALQRDLRLAKQLGFRFVRPKIGVVSSDLVPHPIWTESVERSLDLAAELDVVIAPEIHSPTPIRHPVVDDYISLIQRTGTKHFGLLIDTGIFQDRPIPLRPGETRETRPAFLDGIGVDPADLKAIGEYVVFVQAKFHDIDENRVDQQIPWRPVLQGLKDAGYTGYLSSEYEGVREPWRSLEQVRRQHSIMREIASDLD